MTPVLIVMDFEAEMYKQLAMEFEEWRPVVGFEGIYEVSSYGRVRRIAISRNKKEPGILVIDPSSMGYPRSHLYRDGQLTRRFNHHLVVEAFIGPRPNGYEVNHKDGNRANNHLSNLEIVTRSENHMHAMYVLRAIDKLPRGEANKNSKLTEQQVLDIRAAYAAGETNYSRLGRRFGISGDHVKNLVTLKFWKHLIAAA